MFPKGQRVLLDTNVIIEAHRVKCWNALTDHFNLETTDMCLTESGSGNPSGFQFKALVKDSPRGGAAE